MSRYAPDTGEQVNWAAHSFTQRAEGQRIIEALIEATEAGKIQWYDTTDWRLKATMGVLGGQSALLTITGPLPPEGADVTQPPTEDQVADMVREGCLLTVQFPNSRSEADTLVIEGEDLWELVSLAGETKDFRVLIGGPPVPMPRFRDPGDWYDWEQCGVVAASEEPIRDGQYGMRVTTLPQPKE